MSLKEDKLRGMAKILYCTFINIYKYYITNYFSYARQRLDKICIEWNYVHYKEFITTLKKKNTTQKFLGEVFSFLCGFLPSIAGLFSKSHSNQKHILASLHL